MSQAEPSTDRRSDLDALRAVAMLLGIVLHAALSFFLSMWVVTDVRQNEAYGWLVSAVHGFRMPLFFMLSGYFSAMLIRRRGIGAFVKHRFKRVFLPLLAGVFTIVPATIAMSTVAMMTSSRKPAAESKSSPADIWTAAEAGDVAAVERIVAAGTKVDAREGRSGATALTFAALYGRTEAVERMIALGADVNARNGYDGGAALHAAAFLGQGGAVGALVRHGANVNLANKRGETPLDVANVDPATTRIVASMMHIKFDDEGLGRRKSDVVDVLAKHGAKAGPQRSIAQALGEIPMFNHLWFLWYLWWLVLALAAVAAVLAKAPALRLPDWLVSSPVRYVWLTALTMVPQWFMDRDGPIAIFGPQTSDALLPRLDILAYYAIFFGFGALSFGRDERTHPMVGRWRWLVPLGLGLFVVFPLGLAVLSGWIKSGETIGEPTLKAVSLFLRSVYPWLMAFGLMGLFERVWPEENRTMRYLSDSAYWLYVAHLPLVIGAQLVVRDWNLPALVKLVLIVTVVTAFLLWTYQTMVRYTWLGRFLNGPRVRPPKVQPTPA
jgi:peptidoglycan/LPS O-acetylase OafA/YrhL